MTSAHFFISLPFTLFTEGIIGFLALASDQQLTNKQRHRLLLITAGL